MCFPWQKQRADTPFSVSARCFFDRIPIPAFALPSGDYRPKPGRFRPPVKLCMELFMASSAWRRASLAAERTMNKAVSGASGGLNLGF